MTDRRASRRALLAVVAMAVPMVAAFSQTTVSGKVSSDAGEPLVGATVVVEGTTVGAVCDGEGRYTLRLPSGAKALEAHFVGYETKSTDIKAGRSVYDFILPEMRSEMGVVVCTGTRTPHLLKDAPIATRVVGAEQIRTADATDVGELMQTELPGAEMSFSMNQQSSLNMQGFGGNAVLFLVDGERLAGETLDNVDYCRLSMDDVEHIEIVKGAASSLYGSNAVGGVVNIISKRARKPWSLNVNARLSKYHNQRYGMTLGLNRGKVSSVTNASLTSVDEIPMPSGGDFSKVFGSRTWNVKERLTYTPTERLSLTGRAGFFFRERDSGATSKERYRDASAGLKGEYSFARGDNMEVAFAFDQYDKSDFSTPNDADVRDYSNAQHTLRGIYNHKMEAFDGTLTAGGDVRRDRLMSYQFEDGGSHRQVSADLFCQLEWESGERWNLIGGVRFDYFSAADQSHVSGKMAAMFRLTDDMRLRASYSGGFRAPSLKEMYMSFDMASIFMIYGNESLKPEKSHNFSVSAEQMRERVTWTASVFHNLVDNRITTAWNAARNGMEYMNMERLRITGGEVSAACCFDSGLRGQVGYTYTHEHIAKGAPETSSTRPHSLTARISYGRNWADYGFRLALSGRAMSKVKVDVYNSLTDYTTTTEQEYPAYTIWKLALSQRIWRGVRVNIAADNIFDYTPDYYYNNSPATTGRIFSAGVSLDFEEWF